MFNALLHRNHFLKSFHTIRLWKVKSVLHPSDSNFFWVAANASRCEGGWGRGGDHYNLLSPENLANKLSYRVILSQAWPVTFSPLKIENKTFFESVWTNIRWEIVKTNKCSQTCKWELNRLSHPFTNSLLISLTSDTEEKMDQLGGTLVLFPSHQLLQNVKFAFHLADTKLRLYVSISNALGRLIGISFALHQYSAKSQGVPSLDCRLCLSWFIYDGSMDGRTDTHKPLKGSVFEPLLCFQWIVISCT